MLTMAQIIRQFWRDLSQFIDLGIPLKTSLNLILTNYSEGNSFAKELKEIVGKLNSESLFSDILAQHPRFFGKGEVNLVRAGEVGGILEVTLGRLVGGGYLDGIPIKADEYKHFYAVLGTCLRSGVPILTSLKIAKDCCSGELQAIVEQLIEEMSVGGDLSSVMSASGLFCPSEVAMVVMGEETGTLDGVLHILAKSC